jgi:hypothetical protein
MTGWGVDLDAPQLAGLFSELSDELISAGQTAQLFVVGGAAMALAYDGSRSTRDVDAVFEPTTIVRQLAEKLAARHGLEGDWINDAAKGFLPGADENARVVFESEALYVQVASPEYLLAMKLYSGRVERDLDDAITLYRICGYQTADQGRTLLSASYPANLLLPRHRYFVEDVATRAATGRA